MKKIEKTLSLISPLVLAVVLLAVKTTAGIYDRGTNFSVVQFFFLDNLDFAMTIGLIIAQSAIAFIIFVSENQQRLSGKWDVRLVPQNWKGKESPGIIGHGRMYLAKSPYGDKDFAGYLHVTFLDQENTALHKGIYEIRLALQKRRVSGQSLMVWGEGFGEQYLTGDPDTPYVRPCLYELEYSEDRQKMAGKANMVDSPTFVTFDAYRA